MYKRLHDFIEVKFLFKSWGPSQIIFDNFAFDFPDPSNIMTPKINYLVLDSLLIPSSWLGYVTMIFVSHQISLWSAFEVTSLLLYLPIWVLQKGSKQSLKSNASNIHKQLILQTNIYIWKAWVEASKTLAD